MTIPKHSRDFDVLDQWALLDDVRLQAEFSSDSAHTLKRIMEILEDQGAPRPEVDRKNFVALVHRMRSLKKDGSVLFGETLLQAAAWLERNEPAKAQNAYREFLRKCTSKFYRDLAQAELTKIR